MSTSRPFSFLFISVYLAVVPLLVGSVLVWQFVTYEAYFQQLSVSGWLMATLFFTLTSILALTQPTLLAIIFGYFLNWLALPYIFVLNMAAIAFVYLLTQQLPLASFEHFLSNYPKAQRLLNAIRGDELRVVFFAKLSPVLPFALTNFILALSGASFRNILLGGFLGMIPRSVLAVWSGMQAKQLRQLIDNPNGSGQQQLIIFSLVIVSSVGLIYLIGKRFNA